MSNPSHLIAAKPVDAAPRQHRALGSLLRKIAAAFERAGQLRMLAELTDDQLRDIGLSRDEAVRAANARIGVTSMVFSTGERAMLRRD